jgi:polyphosphate kinase
MSHPIANPATQANVAGRARRQTQKPNLVVSGPAHLEPGDLYINRELSLLAFQRRVFREAQDPRNPLLERIKFVSILGSNIDEFFMVRVASLWQQIETRNVELSLDGKPPGVQLELIRQDVTSLMDEIYKLWRSELVPALNQAHIRILSFGELSENQRATASEYFRRIVYPVLTPLAVDPGRPFPHISNLSLNVAAVVTSEDGVERFARVKVPDTLPQLVPVPALDGHCAFVWLEDLIVHNLDALFPEMEIVETSFFHVTRDAELAIQELEADDLLESVQEAVWRRRFRDAVRLQVDRTMPQKLVDLLITNLELDQSDVYRVDGPIDLSRLKVLLSSERPTLKDKPFTPYVPTGLTAVAKSDMFAMIQQSDILLHHPYESFQPVVDFLRVAAADPDVMAIKMTLYRVGAKSPIVGALLDAIQHGKQVAVLVELKARFDEESNIEWAQKLEGEGVHVVYGLLGLKVHAKVAMVVRREGDTIRRYLHLGTGNYNPTTARLYTDLGFLTTDEELGADVSDLFNHLTGYSAKKTYRKLLVAPLSLRPGLEDLIKQEIEQHNKNGNGYMILKMNALEDPGMIRALYDASNAGVKIDLIVRGVCSLRPGVPGLSENIRVRSILGRFLEHSRIFYFYNGGKETTYLGSADMMPRNLNRRVEILFPIENPKLVRRLRDEILHRSLDDDAGAWSMNSDGSFTPPGSGSGKQFSSQEWFLSHHGG